MTEVDARLPGDTWAPALGPGWVLGARVPATGWSDSTAGLRFRVSQWRRGTTGSDAVRRVLAEQLGQWTVGGRSGAVGAGR